MKNPDNEKNDKKISEKWPVLCEEAMPGIVGDFVRLATRNSEADPAAVLATFLVRFGVEIGSGPYLMIGDTKHQARLFAAIVGATSKARKGTSARPVDRLFADIPGKFVNSLNSFDMHDSLYTYAKTSPGPLSSGEGLLWQVSDQNKAVDSQKRLFVLDEELAAALKSTERSGNTLSTTIRKLWDSGDIEPLTKNDRLTVTGAHVGIVTHITMEELKGSLKAIELHNGLANRFLWICSKRSRLVPNPTPMPKDELAVIQRHLINIIQKITAPVKMTLTSEASELWGKWYEDISKDHLGLVGSVINRAEAQLMRLAMIYALIDESYEIGIPNLKAARAFWEYAEASAKYIFSRHDENPVCGKIITALHSSEKTKTELYKAFGNNIEVRKIDDALKELEDLNLIACRQYESTGQKPKTVYALRI